MNSARKRPLLAATAAAVAVLIPSLPAGASGTTVSSSPAFISAPLPPYSTGHLARNQDGEPGIGVDGAGNFWIGSDIAPYAANDPRAVVALSGEDVWTSANGGQSYHWVTDPFTTNSGNTPSLAGEDSDIAVAPVKNAKGYYNVYAVSLWIGASSLAISQDGGHTWIIDPLGGIPAQDRPWVAAFGACTVYMAYHQLPTFSPVVSKYNLCNVSTTTSETINPVQNTHIFTTVIPGLSNAFGKIWVDNSPSSPRYGAVYVPMEDCNLRNPNDILGQLEASSGCATGTRAEIDVAVSTDGDVTWKDYTAAHSSYGEVTVWPDNIATDAQGNAYLVWTDNRNSYIDISFASTSPAGAHWTSPQRLNVTPSRDAIYPTVAAIGDGQVDVAWYGGDRAGNSNDAALMGQPNAGRAANWYVYFAKSTDYGASFVQTRATDRIHTGVLCTQGSGCSISNSRNLLDDFGIAISPVTKLASLAFTDDQPQGQQATAFTAYATEQATPQVNAPETPVAVLLVLSGGAGAAVTAARLRRRRNSAA